MRTIRALTILTSLSAALLVLPVGCEDSGGETGDPQPQPSAAEPMAEQEAAPIPELAVPEVAELVSAGSCVVVDANNAGTRERFGTVPGAMLLTSSGRYDPSAELPGDQSTKLVFYCSNEDCSASDGAAGRARNAGYTDVNVMRAGIAGWVEAGNETAPAS